MTAWRKTKAFFARDLRTDLSYKVSFAIEAVDIVLGVAAYFFFSRLLGDTRPDGYDAFAFILIGIAVNGAMSSALTAYAQGIEAEQTGGTLKLLLVTPTAPSAIMLLSSCYPNVRASLDALIYIAGGVAFGVEFDRVNVPAALVVFALALAAFSAVGVGSAAFSLVLKRGDPLVWFFGALSWVFGGVFFPVDMLPDWLQTVSRLLPITHALDALRATLLTGAGLADVARPAGVLAGFPVALGAFGLAVRRVKQTGTLDHY